MSPRVATPFLLAVTLLGALSACGDEGPERPPATASDAVPSLTPATAPPSSPSDTFKRVRVSGTVTVRDDCVVLTDGHGATWSLTGRGAEGFVDGEQVVVTGRSTPQESDCGTPLSVTTVETTAN